MFKITVMISKKISTLKKEENNMSIYNANYPERYNWDLLDSHKLSKIAEEISAKIDEDLKTEDRNLVPGLRTALNIIADCEEVFNSKSNPS